MEGNNTLHPQGSCIRILRLPFTKLTYQDAQLLESVCSTLYGHDQAAVQSSCNFISSSMSQDYPAEIFLQKPRILFALLKLLAVPLEENASSNLLHTVRCLDAVIRGLHRRILLLLHPDFSCSKEEGSFLSRSVGASSSFSTEYLQACSAANEADDESAFSLQRLQEGEGIQNAISVEYLTLPDFCGMVMRTLLPLLRTSSVYCFVSIHKAFLSALSLLKETVKPCVLLEACAEISVLERDLKTCMQELEICITFYKKNNSMIGEHAGDRLLYIAVALLTWKFLDVVMGVNNSPQVLPTFLKTALEDIVMDNAFQNGYPVVHSSLLEYTCLSDATFRDVYKLKEFLAESVISAQMFFKMSQSGVSPSELVIFYNLFADSLPCLPFLPNMNLIKEFIVAYSSMFMFSSDAANAVACATLLQLLKHSDVSVRQKAWECCTQIVKNALPTDSVSSIPEAKLQRIQFILQQDIITCIVICGLRVCYKDISDNCATLLTSLLHSRWLLSPSNWKEILLCLSPVYPVLQCYTRADTTLGSYLLTTCNPDTLDGVVSLSALECLMSNLRNLFCVDDKVKESALHYLLRLLALQEGSATCSPRIQNVANNLSLIEMFHSYNVLFSMRKANATEQSDSLKTLLAVVANTGMDSDMRAACLHQVSLLVEDKKVHAHFQDIGGDDLVRKILVDFVEKSDGSATSLEMVADALRILRARLLLNSEFRSWLSGNESYCFTVLQCFLRHNYARGVALFPAIFAAMAFHRFLNVNIMEDKYEICLPGIFLERFHFPFRISSCDPYSEVNSMVSHEVSALDTAALFKQFLLLWHLKWYGGERGLTEVLQDDVTLQKSPHFSVLKEEVNLITATCPKSSAAILLDKLCNATAHTEALDVISRLCILIQAAPSQLPDGVWEMNSWKAALNRFLVLVPASSEDAKLLSSVFSLLEAVLLAGDVPPKMLEWIWHTVLLQHGPCQHIIFNLQHFLTPGELHDSFRLLTETLLKFLESLLARSESRLPEDLESLILGLGAALGVTEISQPYNLVRLQSILSCLHHALAASAHAKAPVSWDRLFKILSPLIEIATVFHFGPENKYGLYVGLKVAQLAALCLHQFADRMSTTGPHEWEQYWVQCEHTNESLSNLGLAWLLPLWTDPDPQIRAAGLGIAASLTCSNYGQKILTDHLQQLVGGLWGVALSFLNDHEEASIVREQAALLLCNLTSKLAPEVESRAVRNMDNEKPLYGHSALLVLLQQCNFYEEISYLVQCYCPDTRLDPKVLGDLADPKCDLGISTLHIDDTVTIMESIHGQHSICTASLLGVVCRLLQNLVILYPEQATSGIRTHQLHLLFLRYILSDSNLSTRAATQTMRTLHEIIKLITQCALHNGSIRTELLQCSGLFIVIFTCLRKASSGLSRSLYTEIWKLISVLLELEGVKAYEVILMCVTLHWNHVGEWLIDFLDTIDSSEECGPFFTVLCQLCTHDYKPESILSDQVCFTNLLDTALSPVELHTEHLEEKKVAISTAGEHIATLLTRMLKSSSNFIRREKNLELELLIATLSSVLSISQTAKDSPSHAGLLELLINDVSCLSDAIKQCKAKQMGVQPTCKSTDIAYTLEQRLELLQNAVFQSPASKEFCCSRGLLLDILQSWWFITGKTSLLTASLKLLLNLTADCITACQSITRLCTIPGSMTLSHHLVVLAQQKMKELSKGKEVICHLVFGVICNLSLADDFRKFLSKVNFLEQCVTLLSDPDIKKWQLQVQQSMWLKMMITLTSSAEGQKLVATTEGALTLLCEWATPNETIGHDVRWNSMLVLRNLCFLPANKGKLLATGTFLKSLQLQLDENPAEKQWLIVGSTLWALLANYQKAKALTHAYKLLCMKIYEVYRIVQHGDGDCCRQTAHVFQSIIGILERQN